MTWPSWLQGTNCLARFDREVREAVDAERAASIASASGPSIISSAMWCDWSNSTAVSRQARCSSRQLVNSVGTTG